jgi:CubicO group peptidase (beta-lactamase class C family)
MEHNGTIAFIVLQHGNIIVEHYYNGYNRDSITTSFSMAKSVVSALLGIAIHDKKIASVDEPITRYLPELLKNDRRFARIKLRHLLEMRSGILFDDSEGSPWSDAAIFYLTPDLHAKITGLKIQRAPDQAYHYSSGDTQLLGLVIQRATGVPLPTYLQQKIWQPMGAAYDASWSLDSSEHRTPKAFCCLNARAIDFARFGQMYLNNGKINGHQIVPAEWIKASTEVHEHGTNDVASRWNIENIDEMGTAYYTWYWRRMPTVDPAADIKMRPGTDFYAEGLLGQVIYIAPKQDMVIVRVGDRWGDLPWTKLFNQIAQLNPG